MPCEGCHVQFTVFKRKRSCYDCKRYYCFNCLANANNYNRKHALCERCLLFTKRPLVRSDLIKLKPKDLIFYLQSRHISTAGCVEKEELIELVLQYVNKRDIDNQTSTCRSGSSSGSSSQHTTPQHHNTDSNVSGDVGGISSSASRNAGIGYNTNNSFDSIKQTCQNFFSNLGDNISDSLANFESRACSKNRPPTTVDISTNVTEQPRISTRVIPTYSSSQQNSPENPIASSMAEVRTINNASITTENLFVNIPLSSREITEINSNSNVQAECNCSDDEDIIATFNDRTRSPKAMKETKSLSLNTDDHDSVYENNPSSCVNVANNCAPSSSASVSKAISQYSKLEIYVNDEESSQSSFEELGAIGGISDDSKTTTDTTSNTTDQWQMLDLKINETDNSPSALNAQQEQPECKHDVDKSTFVHNNELVHNDMEKPGNSTETQEQQINHPPPTPTHVHPAPRVKKVTRRRSESCLNRRKPQISVEDEDEEDINNTIQSPCIEEECQTFPSSFTTRKTGTKRCCTRCGKHKANIRQQVEKMRQHLESSQMSEADIKHELSEFLAYLEQRTKSIEYSDSEAGGVPNVNRYTHEAQEDVSGRQQIEEQISREENVNADVHQSGSNFLQFHDKDSRFINLDEIQSIKQLEGLTVKQLKEILMLHRVDYKGCCEKQELFDRVERLWKNLKSSPAVEKLLSDELCKICMDAPIECVILECGHMATCTNCGKVLSECPICRQYIVRVVRFFRA